MAQADEFQQVAPGVVQWQAYDSRIKTDLCASAVVAAAGLVFIDPIPLAAEALEELTAHATPHAIVVTNHNHWRSAEDYRRRFSIPVHAHPSANEDGTPDVLLHEDDVLAGDLRVIELPGGAIGEIAVLHPGGSLHLGDALIHVEPIGFALLPDQYCTDAKQLRESLRKLLQADFQLLLFAHGTPIVTDARARLARLLA